MATEPRDAAHVGAGHGIDPGDPVNYCPTCAAAYRVFTPAGMAPDENAVAQLEMCMADERAVSGALMADHHLGYSMPIGGVVAYQDAISPSGVGYDIACGNKAVLTTLLVEDVVGTGTRRLPQGAAGETPPETATGTSQGRETTPEGEPKNEAPTRAYSDPGSESVLISIMREIQRTVAFGLGHGDTLLFEVAQEFVEEEWSEPVQFRFVRSAGGLLDIVLDKASRGWTAEQVAALDRLTQILLGRKKQMHEYRTENEFMKSERARLQRTIGDLRQKIASRPQGEAAHAPLPVSERTPT